MYIGMYLPGIVVGEPVAAGIVLVVLVEGSIDG